ncbi:MAG: tRNA epoxyqueuosine(34) reductase QueG [Proteobacteria bacterium]|nr:MAG: tRNA epoxyqueuosine(34) reductase QueG [Pseudomonadota bacterium]
MTTFTSQQAQTAFVEQLEAWGRELGFQQVGISNIDLSQAEVRLNQWLGESYHGEMGWMASHGLKRSRPELLEAGTRSVISVRMDYLPAAAANAEMVLNHPELAYISRYALGRDYHKVLKGRLKRLADKIQQEVGEFGYRVFVDSAPVLEKPIAVKAGLGWVGKHSNILNRSAGSWFFLGEIYTDLALPETGAQRDHCGNCTACIDICPTQAIVAPYVVDARRCISYLTIELKGPIPVEFRQAMGNRIYGCDDCQLTCPWNRFATESTENDYQVRNGLDGERLLTLFGWTEQEFLDNMQGSPIRRISYDRWQRNLAVALGNAPYHAGIIAALESRLPEVNEMVAEHINWAIQQQKYLRAH